VLSIIHHISGFSLQTLARYRYGRLHFLTWLKSSRLDFTSLRSKYLLRPEFN